MSIIIQPQFSNVQIVLKSQINSIFDFDLVKLIRWNKD